MKKTKKILSRIICCFLLLHMLLFATGCDMIYAFVPELCPHEWELTKVLEQPTCTEQGFGEYFCPVCESEKEDIIERIGHEFENFSSNPSKHWKDCKNCTEKIEESDHTFTNIDGKLKCSTCFYEYVETSGQIEFHFIMLGNDYAGDCIYVKAGENDILIDAGSRANSVPYIKDYLDDYVTDGILEYVIVTHSDQDHIAGFASANSIFDLYKCEVIIDFPKTNKPLETEKGNPTLYADYLTNRDEEVEKDGAVHFSALDCYNNENGGQRVYNLTADGGVTMEILYNYYYDHYSSDENDYSVCLMFYHGARQFLFTGDLEEDGEEKLAQKYDFSQVELFKAGHHGSPTSSTEKLLSEIQPKICVLTCCAGSVEYTDFLPNTFPSRAVMERISQYTSKIYAPIYIDIVIDENKPTTTYQGKTIPNYKNADEFGLLNGNIVVISKSDEQVTVQCSNNNLSLKDTLWYQNTLSKWQDPIYN